jgi:putative transposase
MWTSRNRARYDRSKLRYPSDVTDEEWELIVPLIPPGKSGGGKRTVIMREVVNGLMYVLSTGCQWRAIPTDLPPKSTVYDYFDLWTYDAHCSASTTRFMSSVVNKRSGKPVQLPPSSIAKA